MIIYKITNNVNGKIYIGQTAGSLENRWRQHRHHPGCRILHKAIKKYGAENFTVEQIDAAANIDELNQKEKLWIQHYDCIAPNGYNLKSGGNRPTYSEASRQRMSRNHADMSGANNPRYGVRLSADTRKKISDSHRGKSLSAQHRLKVAMASPKRKCVLNIDTGEHFSSSRMAEKQCGLPHGTVSRVCRGEGHTAGGFHWRYVQGGDANV